MMSCLIVLVGYMVLLAQPGSSTFAAEPQHNIACCNIVANAALKGRFGRLVVAFPAGANPRGTRIAVFKDGKEVQADYGSHSFELLSGTYDVKIAGKTVLNVTVKAGHDTNVKVGVLRIAGAKSRRAAVLDGGQEIAGAYGGELIGLPAGAFEVHFAGRTERVTISAGQVTDLKEQPQQTAVQVSLTLPTDGGVTGGGPVTGTVTIPGGGKAVGAVKLTSSHPAIASVPAQVVIGPGQTILTFSVATVPVTAPTQVTISATHAGLTGAAALTILPPVLSGVTIFGGEDTGVYGAQYRAPVWGGRSARAQVTITGRTAGGGLTVDLSSSKPEVASVPPSVFVEPNQSSVGFEIPTQPVPGVRPIKISASHVGVTKEADLTVLPPVPRTLEFYRPGTQEGTVVNVTGVQGGATLTGKVTLNGPAPDGYIVGLSIDTPQFVSIPSSLRYGPGQSNGVFTIETTGVPNYVTVNIRATVHVGNMDATTFKGLPISPPGLVGLTLSQPTVTGGQSVTGTLRLGGPAPTGGVLLNVRLRSSKPEVAQPPPVVGMGGGAFTQDFTITTTSVQEDTLVAIEAEGGSSGRPVGMPLTVTK